MRKFVPRGLSCATLTSRLLRGEWWGGLASRMSRYCALSFPTNATYSSGVAGGLTPPADVALVRLNCANSSSAIIALPSALRHGNFVALPKELHHGASADAQGITPWRRQWRGNVTHGHHADLRHVCVF